MLFPRTTSWGRLAASWLLAMTAVACQPEPPELPDPNEQLPAVDCGDAAPLTITRLSPDSLLAWPPWLQVCTLCPATSITLQLGDDDNAAVHPDALVVDALEAAEVLGAVVRVAARAFALHMAET